MKSYNESFHFIVVSLLIALLITGFTTFAMSMPVEACGDNNDGGCHQQRIIYKGDPVPEGWKVVDEDDEVLTIERIDPATLNTKETQTGDSDDQNGDNGSGCTH